ncbi:hypothetical protein MPER_03919, partial [Moniliophthora perniciosa FA553]
MRKLQKEVDDVLNGRPMKPEDLGNMPYLVAVMRESLRLSPTASLRSVYSLEDTTLSNGKYFIKKGTRLVCQQWLNHRDPVVWGNDAEEFKPERMLDGKFEALPPNAWHPRVANDAARHGFRAKLDNIDSFTGALPTDGPVIIFTASYEGQPADNAARFIDWFS